MDGKLNSEPKRGFEFLASFDCEKGLPKNGFSLNRSGQLTGNFTAVNSKELD